MKTRLAIAGIAVLVVGALALADAPAGDEAASAESLHRDLNLIQALVDHGLSLAVEDDPIKRADVCSDLAVHLAGAVREAATEHNGDRAGEMGAHLASVLRQGVAGNLRIARHIIPPGSTDEARLDRVGERVTKITKPLEDVLHDASVGDGALFQPLLRSLREARTDVDRARRP